jgi:molybdate transport system substrate-binding protein
LRERFGVAITFLLLLGFLPAAHAQSEVTLLVPAPTRVALDKIIAVFEMKTGNKVTVTNGTTLGTKQQVAKGDAFDVPVMQPPYDEALASGNLIANSGRTIASFVEGVCVKKGAPKPDISSADAIKRLLLGAKSIDYPDPAAGSAGVRVVQAFEKLGITEQMKSKAKVVANSGPAQMDVANGDVDLCLAYLSDLRNPGIEAVGPLPFDIFAPNDMVGFVSSHAKDPKASLALLDFLSAPDVADMYTSAGMKPGRTH